MRPTEPGASRARRPALSRTSSPIRSATSRRWLPAVAALVFGLSCADGTPTSVPVTAPKDAPRGELDLANSRTVDLGGGNYLCYGLAATQVGTAGPDVLTGVDGVQDVIVGLGGDDTITLNDDGDVACGGPGVDTITGGAGNDFMSGEEDRDILDGGGGNDFMVGRQGVNTLIGGAGDDHMVGGNESDTLRGGPGEDFLKGSSGPNVLEGGDDDDFLDAGAGGDMFDGGPGFDSVKRLNCSQGDVATGTEMAERTDCADADKDTVLDVDDNCPAVANGDQADADGDLIGDVCDPDRDGDGEPNATDNCPDDPNPGQADSNGNGVGDVCDNEAPVGVADAYFAVGNHSLSIAAAIGLTENDTDADADPLAADAETKATTGGGTVTIAADGSFTYLSAAGFTGLDTFTYTVDDGTDTDTATATLRVDERVFYVDDSFGGTPDGRETSPFTSISGATAPAGTGEMIFVFAGTYDEGVVLEDMQQLIGEGIASPVELTFGAAVSGEKNAAGSGHETIELFAGGGANPHVNRTGAGTGITLASSNTIRSIDVTTADGIGISGSAVGNLIVNPVAVAATGSSAVSLNGPGTIDATFASLSSTNASAAGVVSGVHVGDLGGTFMVDGTTTVTDAGLAGIRFNSTGALTSTFTGKVDVSVTAAGVDGIQSFTGGTLVISDATSTVSTTSGVAVHLSGTTIGAGGLNFADVSKDGSGSGIVLTNVGSGSFSATAGTIQNTTGVGVDIDGGTGDVSVGGTVSNASGRTVQVTNHTGGTVTISGSVDENGSGIDLVGNTGATMTFSGGVDIATATSTGFNATGGGTVNVSGAGNTITTTTGTGLNISGTTIGSSDVTFQSISVNGAANGIVLNATGSSGGLVITGDGSNTNNASGGTIQNTSGHGILVTDTQDLSLTSIRIENPGDAASEHGILATGLRGTNLLRASTITGFDQASGDGFRVVNNSVNLTELRVNGSTFSASDGNDGLAVFGQGTSNMTVIVETSLFTDLEGDAIDVIAGDLTGSTATVALTVNDNDFTNAGATGNGGVQARAAKSGSLTGSITNNTFNDTHRLASTAGVIEIQGNESGSVNLTVSGNDIDNFKQNGIGVVADDASNVTVVVSNNTIDTVEADRIGIRSAIRNTGATRLTIQNNTIGGTTAMPGSAGTRSPIDIEVFSLPDPVTDVRILIDSNTLRANKSSSGSEVLDLYVDDNADVHATVTNNAFTNVGSGDGAEITTDESTPIAGTTLCLDLRSNTATNPGLTTGDIELVELAGTYSVEDLANVVANNPSANIVFDPNQAAFTNASSCLTP